MDYSPTKKKYNSSTRAFTNTSFADRLLRYEEINRHQEIEKEKQLKTKKKKYTLNDVIANTLTPKIS